MNKKANLQYAPKAKNTPTTAAVERLPFGLKFLVNSSTAAIKNGHIPSAVFTHAIHIARLTHMPEEINFHLNPVLKNEQERKAVLFLIDEMKKPNVSLENLLLKNLKEIWVQKEKKEPSNTKKIMPAKKVKPKQNKAQPMVEKKEPIITVKKNVIKPS